MTNVRAFTARPLHNSARCAKLAAAALVLATAAIVPVSHGPLASEAQAQLKWPKIKAPKIKLPTIVPKPEKVAGCGANGEKPCVAVKAFPSCEGKLVEDFGRKICRKSDNDVINAGKNAIRELGPLVKTIAGSAISCGVNQVMAGASKRNKRQTAEMLLALPCFNGMLDEARSNGYRTLTIGGSGGASIGIGAEGENGFAFDTSGNRRVATYHTLSLKFLSLGASTAVNVGLYKAAYNRIAGDAHGMSAQFTKLGGGGIAVWYGYNSDRVAGLTAVITAGAKGELAYVRNTTRVVDAFTVAAPPPPRRAAVAPPPTRRVETPRRADPLVEFGPPPAPKRAKPEFGWAGLPVDGNYRASKDAASLTRYFITSGKKNQKLFYRYRQGNGAWSKWRAFKLVESGWDYHHYVEANDSGQSFTIWDDGDRIEWKKSQKRNSSRFTMEFERYLGRYCGGKVCQRSAWGPGGTGG